jgi:hypothetical protein
LVVESVVGNPVVMDRIVKAITKGWEQKNERQRNNLKFGAAQTGENNQNPLQAEERSRAIAV